jgi:hypothetical protein
MFANGARMSVAGLVLVCGLAVPLASAQSTPPMPVKAAMGPAAPIKAEDGLPIRKITLYRSGVGYFERSGEVSNNAEVQLRFNTDQINDILKSMILLDLNGGKIESVQYGSKEPLAKRLASFGINIADNPGASEILQRLRGTPVKLTMPEGEVSGTIMNVESRPTVYPGNDKSGTVVHNLPWINLVTPAGVKSYNLTNCSGFQILDTALAEELGKALGALAEYRADRTKTVDLRFTGNGARRVAVGYVHEMPVWKTSYRLLLPELDSSGQTKGQLTIQGWAIVENTTDQDWNGVQLSLVSGRPVSFQMDLYEPLFSSRPWVAVPTIPGVSPRVFAGGMEVTDEAKKLVEDGRANKAAYAARRAGRVETRSADDMLVPMAAPAPGATGAYGGVTASDMADYAPKAAAAAATVGEVFQFQVEAPVSIERQRSAMIPILATNITGRRVSIFNASDGSQFPMRGVEITNDSNLALLPGPLSVSDGAAYAGDAQIGQVPKGDKRMIAYALDLDMAVQIKPESHSTLRKITVVEGMIRQSFRDRLSTSYEFADKDTQHGRTLILEHPKAAGYELVETEKPTEQTQDLYRFTLPIDAGRSRKIAVTQERTRYEDVAVTNFDLNTLAAYHKDGKLSNDVMAAVRKAADKQAAIAATERQIAELTAKMEEVSKDQARIRQNMGAIDKNSSLYVTYVGKLTDQETKLEQSRDAQGKLQKQLEEQRNDLNQYLRNLTVE